MSWITKTAGWSAMVLGMLGFALGLVDGDTAALLITNGMGYIGVDRKFKRLGLNGQTLHDRGKKP